MIQYISIYLIIYIHILQYSGTSVDRSVLLHSNIVHVSVHHGPDRTIGLKWFYMRTNNHPFKGNTHLDGCRYYIHYIGLLHRRHSLLTHARTTRSTLTAVPSSIPRTHWCTLVRSDLIPHSNSTSSHSFRELRSNSGGRQEISFFILFLLSLLRSSLCVWKDALSNEQHQQVRSTYYHI